jgi:hypothetical protein
MDDNRGVMFAIALLLFWIAGLAFFTAFHPGGITKDNGDAAQNPTDVIKYLLAKGGEGASDSATITGTPS